jgi:hypothetical protein
VLVSLKDGGVCVRAHSLDVALCVPRLVLSVCMCVCAPSVVVVKRARPGSLHTHQGHAHAHAKLFQLHQLPSCSSPLSLCLLCIK